MVETLYGAAEIGRKRGDTLRCSKAPTNLPNEFGAEIAIALFFHSQAPSSKLESAIMLILIVS